MRCFFHLFSLFFLKDIFQTFLYIILGLGIVFIAMQLPSYGDILVGGGDFFTSFILLILYIYPQVFKIVVPLALMAAPFWVIFHMAQDRELEAWLASGLPLKRFLKNSLLLGIFAGMVILFSLYYGEPHSKREMQAFRWIFQTQAVETILRQKLQPQVILSNPLPIGNFEIALYVDKRNEDLSELENLMIHVKERKSTKAYIVLAQKAGLLKEETDTDTNLILSLKDGAIYYSELPTQMIPPVDNVGPMPLPSSWDIHQSKWSIFQFEKMNFSLSHLLMKYEGDIFQIKAKSPYYMYQELALLRKHNLEWRDSKDIMRKHFSFLEPIVLALSFLFLPLTSTLIAIHDPRRQSLMSSLMLIFLILFFYILHMALPKMLMNMSLVPWHILWLEPMFQFLLLFLMWRYKTKYPPSTSIKEFLKIEFLRGKTK